MDEQLLRDFLNEMKHILEQLRELREAIDMQSETIENAGADITKELSTIDSTLWKTIKP